MSDSGHPVTVAVRRPDGSVEQVRVGTAYPEGDGFRLELGELRIGGAPARASSGSYGASRSSQGSYGGGGGGGYAGGGYGGGSGGGGSAGGDGMRFPNYGRSKGAPIYGATEQDLEYYANGARRTLNDPSKARFHDKERALLAAIEAELARQRGGGGGGGGSGGGYDDTGSGGYGGGGGGGGYGGEEPPPPGDDDAPF